MSLCSCVSVWLLSLSVSVHVSVSVSVSVSCCGCVRACACLCVSFVCRWVAHAIKKNEMVKVAVLYAHAAMLWMNMTFEELTEDVVVSFLSSQLFLATRFKSVSQAQPGVARKRKEGEQDDAMELGIPEVRCGALWLCVVLLCCVVFCFVLSGLVLVSFRVVSS